MAVGPLMFGAIENEIIQMEDYGAILEEIRKDFFFDFFPSFKIVSG